jgi:class 3 adenylate cyclase
MLAFGAYPQESEIARGQRRLFVIGTSKFSYDLWGDTVNTASRMESTGQPGRIQISGATRDLLGDRFVCEPRGSIKVKGLTDMETWFLESRI